MKNEFIDDLATTLKHKINAGDFVQQSKDEIEQSLRILLESTLRKLNLVSREEFDAQCAVLERTHQKLEQLEQLLKELQANTP